MIYVIIIILYMLLLYIYNVLYDKNTVFMIYIYFFNFIHLKIALFYLQIIIHMQISTKNKKETANRINGLNGLIFVV